MEVIVGALTAVGAAALVAVLRPEIIVRQARLVLALTAGASVLAACALIDFAPGSAAGGGYSPAANSRTAPSIAEYESLPAALRSTDRAGGDGNTVVRHGPGRSGGSGASGASGASATSDGSGFLRFANFQQWSRRLPGPRMSLDPSEEPMIADGDPSVAVYDEAVDDFGNDDMYVIALQTRDAFSFGSLTRLRAISDQVRRLPGVRSVESIVETTSFRYIPESDMVEVDSLIDEIPTDTAELEALRERTLSDPIYPRTLVSSESTTVGLNVAFRSMTDGDFIRAGLDRRIIGIVQRETSAEADSGQTASGVDGARRGFNVTGRQHVKSLTHGMMVGDLSRLIPLAVLVGATVARIVTGSLRNAVLPVGSSLLATLWVFGGLAWLGRPLTLITLVLGPTLICVGSVYGVHVLARFDEILEEAAAEGGSNSPEARSPTEPTDPSHAALECLRYVRTPVAIAGATTIAGFGALLLSDTPAIRELGAASALGIAAVTTLAITAVPAALAVLPARSTDRTTPGPMAAIDRGLVVISRLATEHAGLTLVLWALVTSVAVALIPRIVVDTDYLTFFDRDSEVRTDFATISDTLVGAVPIYVTLDGGEEGTFREPENLRALARLQERIDRVEGVSTTLSMVDLVRLVNRAIERDDPEAARIPDTRGEVAETLFLVPKTRMRQFATTNHSRANILVRTGLSGSAEVLALERRLREAIRQTNLPPGISADVTGNTIVVNHGADGIASNQVSTVAAATLVIFLIVARAFGSVTTGMLALIPNVVPVLVFFGVLGAGAAPLSLPTSLIGCIALGIAVDDTAHFLVGYRQRRQGGMAVVEATTACVTTLGRPIVTTSLMLITGFLVLSLSGFATLREFGYLTALTMLTCLGADLLLLPAILVRARV